MISTLVFNCRIPNIYPATPDEVSPDTALKVVSEPSSTDACPEESASACFRRRSSIRVTVILIIDRPNCAS